MVFILQPLTIQLQTTYVNIKFARILSTLLTVIGGDVPLKALENRAVLETQKRLRFKEKCRLEREGLKFAQPKLT